MKFIQNMRSFCPVLEALEVLAMMRYIISHFTLHYITQVSRYPQLASL